MKGVFMKNFKNYSESEKKEKRDRIIAGRVVKNEICDTPCSTPCDTPCSTPCSTPCG